MKLIVPYTWISGVPRGYGDNRTTGQWRDEIANSLEDYIGRTNGQNVEETGYEITLAFYIFPGSEKYGRQNLPHGPDLDNLVKNTVDILHLENHNLRIILDDKFIFRIDASKILVDDDIKMGLWIQIVGME